MSPKPTYTENLDNYHNMSETRSCFLDGRYFNKVFKNYPGLIKDPLTIRISRKGGYYINLKDSKINTDYPGLLRLVINTPTSSHSNLLILDLKDRKVYRFESLGENSPYYNEINTAITTYLEVFFDFDLINLNLELDSDVKSPRCFKSGFCVAYNILYGYCFLNNNEFDPSDIRRFAYMIEHTYGILPKDGTEIEYGNDGVNNKNTIIGGIGGASIGGLVAGPIGILAGGALGAFTGSVL